MAAASVHAGCSSSEPLFASGGDAFSLSFAAIPLSPSPSLMDWSDFPVLSQYNEDMPVPKAAVPASYSPRYLSSSSPRESLRTSYPSIHRTPTMPWEVPLDSMKPKKRDPNKKSVSFGPTLEIRSYNLVVGDHPCCPSLALELGWKRVDAEVVDLETYESHRCYQRRHIGALRLSYWDRKRRLLDQSSSDEEQPAADGEDN